MDTTITIGQVILFIVFVVVWIASSVLWWQWTRGLDFLLRGDDGWWSVWAVIGHIFNVAIYAVWIALMWWALVLR